jgi:lysophospholipid acyltransferase (LPLAT)-like uncharacterized protein
MSKKILKSATVQWVLSFLVSLWLRLVYVTSTIRMEIDEAAKPFMDGREQAIFCFWHGRMILQPFVRPKSRKMRVLISHHRDGAFITAILGWFGIGTVRGSSSKGGGQAVRELITVLKSGDNITITPDGPKGPAFVAQHGAAYIAQRTGLPVIPMAFGSSRGKRFASWDQFLLPYPFSRVLFVVGVPQRFDASIPIAEVSQTLSDVINHAMQEADRKVAA